MVTMTKELFYERVIDALDDAHCIAWDGCHKIYLALDETEANWFRSEYEVVFQGDSEQMFDELYEWWQSSCSLRFVQSVEHNEDDPNAGFTSLIDQFDEEDDDE
jgi:hypothetical protein